MAMDILSFVNGLAISSFAKFAAVGAVDVTTSGTLIITDADDKASFTDVTNTSGNGGFVVFF